jgi:dTDP-4-amino-4,6-dideoxygalactose transaminase
MKALLMNHKKNMQNIPFNKPYFSGNELHYMKQAIEKGKISGNGYFTQQCHNFFSTHFGFKKCLLTTSCTDALEMVSILLDIQPGDEIIAPSYTFVSTVNAFALRGAVVRLIDSHNDQPNINEKLIESAITEKTKAIIVVHYAGVACNLDEIKSLATKYNLALVEDAAQAIDSYYYSKEGELISLGSIGDFATFSFHETKNITSGEGGMLVINNEAYFERAEIIRDKGTNQSKFFRGEVEKYSWIDLGSSFLPSELNAAFLFAQLEKLETIQSKRKKIWNSYYNKLNVKITSGLELMHIPKYAYNNAHMFYIICQNEKQRDLLILHLKKHKIQSVFHYVPLHLSSYYLQGKNIESLPNAEKFGSSLIRLPFYYELTEDQIENISQTIIEFS